MSARAVFWSDDWAFQDARTGATLHLYDKYLERDMEERVERVGRKQLACGVKLTCNDAIHYFIITTTLGLLSQRLHIIDTRPKTSHFPT